MIQSKKRLHVKAVKELEESLENGINKKQIQIF